MKSLLSHVGIALFAIASALAVGATGCQQGGEGDRCNPNLSHDECGAGLACTQPVDCPENYCCPTSGDSNNPYCKPGCAGGQASICDAGGDADCPVQSTGDDSSGDDGAASGDGAPE
ncbi:MAG TPA: hypothetical protein VIF15_06265 [Polyangiaceae bacterium]|jgi:hypothetical protein